MNWLARLKKTDANPSTYLPNKRPGDAENLTKPVIKTAVPAANDPTPDPDRWCWPHSDAMNTAEINTFTARVRQFREQGLSESEADSLADKLMLADREGHLCDFPINGLPGTASPKPSPQPAPDKRKANPFTIEGMAAWRPLAQAYHAHHFSCPFCIAAGKGYGLRCGAGTTLWAAYTSAAMDNDLEG